MLENRSLVVGDEEPPRGEVGEEERRALESAACKNLQLEPFLHPLGVLKKVQGLRDIVVFASWSKRMYKSKTDSGGLEVDHPGYKDRCDPYNWKQDVILIRTYVIHEAQLPDRPFADHKHGFKRESL